MSDRPDDDALSWEGDDDPTLDVGAAASPPITKPPPPPVAGADDPAASEPVALPHGYDAVGRGADQVGRIEADGSVTMPGEAQPLGNAALVGLGLLGGVYLLWTIGWIVGGFRLQGRSAYLVADVMFQGSFWLAILAPALWFATVFLLTRRSATWVRILWLVGGAILLVPWPFMMVGAVGQ